LVTKCFVVLVDCSANNTVDGQDVLECCQRYYWQMIRCEQLVLGWHTNKTYKCFIALRVVNFCNCYVYYCRRFINIADQSCCVWVGVAFQLESPVYTIINCMR